MLQLLAVVLVFYSTMRYLLDAVPAWALLSMIGFWLAYRRLARWPIWRGGYTLAGTALILFSIAMEILTGFSSDLPRLRAANPALLGHLRLFFSVLARRLGWQ